MIPQPPVCLYLLHAQSPVLINSQSKGTPAPCWPCNDMIAEKTGYDKRRESSRARKAAMMGNYENDGKKKDTIVSIEATSRPSSMPIPTARHYTKPCGSEYDWDEGTSVEEWEVQNSSSSDSDDDSIFDFDEGLVDAAKVHLPPPAADLSVHFAKATAPPKKQHKPSEKRKAVPKAAEEAVDRSKDPLSATSGLHQYPVSPLVPNTTGNLRPYACGINGCQYRASSQGAVNAHLRSGSHSKPAPWASYVRH